MPRIQVRIRTAALVAATLSASSQIAEVGENARSQAAERVRVLQNELLARAGSTSDAYERISDDSR